jgi:nucleoside phosphorylase
MSKEQRIHEDFEVSCNVLAKLIVNRKEPHERMLLLKDFLTKSKQIRPSVATQLALEIMTSFVDPEVQGLMTDFKSEAMVARPRADVAIITILPEELKATKIAFGIDATRSEDRRERGLRFWNTIIQNGSSREDLKVILTMVGKARNVECAVACSRVFQTFDVGLCVLVGIAAGLESKVKIGDVVAPDLVLDYEGARVESDGPKKRPLPYPLNKIIERDMNYFEPKFGSWYKDFAEGFRKLNTIEPVPTLPVDWKPEYHRGVILAGEKLLADGSLPEMRTEYHDRVRAAEMEGSGFANVCDEYAIPWLVFRGISDFGNPKKPDSDEWRTTAALAAATAVCTFVKSDYRKQIFKF